MAHTPNDTQKNFEQWLKDTSSTPVREDFTQKTLARMEQSQQPTSSIIAFPKVLIPLAAAAAVILGIFVLTPIGHSSPENASTAQAQAPSVDELIALEDAIDTIALLDTSEMDELYAILK